MAIATAFYSSRRANATKHPAPFPSILLLLTNHQHQSIMSLASAAPILALLDEPDYSLKEYALQSLDASVDQLWAEIADHISQM